MLCALRVFAQKVENLDNCPRLDTLNLSHNFIFTIENCGSHILGELNTLNLSHNKLHTADDISVLSDCLTLSVLDLSHNRIDDLLIVNVLAKMPELRVLVLTGNPVVSLIPSYRKTMINECVSDQTISKLYASTSNLLKFGLFFRNNWLIWIAGQYLRKIEHVPKLGNFFIWYIYIVLNFGLTKFLCRKRGGYEEERREHARWLKAERRKVRESVNCKYKLVFAKPKLKKIF